jgi:hypothetical protein
MIASLFIRRVNQHGDWWEYQEISGKEWHAGFIAKKVSTTSHAMKT